MEPSWSPYGASMEPLWSLPGALMEPYGTSMGLPGAFMEPYGASMEHSWRNRISMFYYALAQETCKKYYFQVQTQHMAQKKVAQKNI